MEVGDPVWLSTGLTGVVTEIPDYDDDLISVTVDGSVLKGFASDFKWDSEIQKWVVVK